MSVFNDYQLLSYSETPWMWKSADKLFYKPSALLPPLLTGLINNFISRAFNEKHESCFMTIYGALCTWDFWSLNFLTMFISVICSLKIDALSFVKNWKIVFCLLMFFKPRSAQSALIHVRTKNVSKFSMILLLWSVNETAFQKWPFHAFQGQSKKGIHKVWVAHNFSCNF